MFARARRAGAVVLAAGTALAAVVAVDELGRFELGRQASVGAVRVAIRTAAARIEHCRERDDRELAALPAHMRNVRDCREEAVNYRLELAVDGESIVEATLRHSGLRRTRPLVFDRLILLQPGERDVRFSFRPVVAADSEDDNGALQRVEWRERVKVEPGRIVLLEIDATGVRVRR